MAGGERQMERSAVGGGLPGKVCVQTPISQGGLDGEIWRVGRLRGRQWL